jgi:hypothetical protein
MLCEVEGAVRRRREQLLVKQQRQAVSVVGGDRQLKSSLGCV